MSVIIFETIGIIGVAIILTVYIMLQTDRINAKGFWYSMLNLLGSFLIMTSIVKDWNLPSFVIEVSWMFISVYGIYKWYSRKR